MEKYIKFGMLPPKTIVKGLFFVTLLELFMFRYFRSVSMSIYSTYGQVLGFKIHSFYIRYLEPILFVIWLKLICEFMYKVMTRVDNE